MNPYQRSERQSDSTVVTLIIVLVIAVAVGLYFNNQNNRTYSNAALSVKELQKK